MVNVLRPARPCWLPALLSALCACGPVMTAPDGQGPDDDAAAPVEDVSARDEEAPDVSPAPSDAAPVPRDAPPEAAASDGGSVGADGGGLVTTRTEPRNTGPSGEIDVTVRVEDHRSFMVVASADNLARVSVLSVVDPRGNTVTRWQDWYNGPRNLTNAFFARRTGTTLNWPVRAEDPSLISGDYRVRIGTYRVDGVTSRPNVDLEVTTVTNRDRDLDRGRVRVVILYADGLSAQPALVAATEGAVARWREVWARVGMDFDVRYAPSTLPTALPYPAAPAGELFLSVSALARDGEIPIVIGETVGSDPGQYGAAGHLPGPIVRSPLRAIVVGWLANAGRDGVFSADDVRLYGEVLAHEAGHYVGLFHPVEQSYEAWDALSDTPECRTQRACEDALGTNLMYPVSICSMGVCVSTTGITAQQRGVMQRYTGTQ